MYKVGDRFKEYGRGWAMYWEIIEKKITPSGNLYTLQNTKLTYNIIEDISEDCLTVKYIKL